MTPLVWLPSFAVDDRHSEQPALDQGDPAATSDI